MVLSLPLQLPIRTHKPQQVLLQQTIKLQAKHQQLLTIHTPVAVHHGGMLQQGVLTPCAVFDSWVHWEYQEDISPTK